MNISPTNIDEVFLVSRPVFPDDRGSFQEVLKLSELEEVYKKKIEFKQINKSVSFPKVLRGLHVAPWGKLVYAYFGNVYQVVVDTRKDSPTFKEVFTVEMGEKNPVSVWVPPGCANGFCVLGDEKAVYGYSVTEEYSPGKEFGILWNDPELASKINWPIVDPILSDKDKINKTLQELGL